MKKYRKKTRLIREGQQRSQFMETNEALYLTSGYIYASAQEAAAAFKGENEHYIYSRFGNPTVSMFEDKMASLEGAEDCWATATGMAAVFASIACQIKNGDKLVSSRALFGSCSYIITEILPKFGVHTELIDGRNIEQWQQSIDDNTKIVFFETPSNPNLEIVDIQKVCDIAHDKGAIVIVDNVFASPILQKPLEFGADIVVYSATKHIDGQGKVLGGCVLGKKDFCQNTLKPFIRNTGPSISPFNAWILNKGLETLELRMSAQSDNAYNIATFLAQNKKVITVLYPYLSNHPQYELAKKQMSAGSTIVSFTLKEKTRKAAFNFLNKLRLINISNNLGDTKSLATHPATTTHHRLSAEERKIIGIEENLVRLSIGLEDIEDIKEDIEQALK